MHVCPVCKKSTNYEHTRTVCEDCLIKYGTVTNKGDNIIFCINKWSESPEILANINGNIYSDNLECYVNKVNCCAVLNSEKKIVLVSSINIPKVKRFK
jgi:hypothetical protein